MSVSADILLITHRSPEYARRSIQRLVDTCPPTARVWLWHNGDDAETLAVTQSFATHPRVHAFHHSAENQRLRAPTNWLWQNATGDFVSKVDDDCLETPGWLETLAAAHASYDRFGAIAAWRFFDEDFVPELASKKLRTFPGGHTILQNLWVQGSGYLLPRRVVVDVGPLRDGESWTTWCRRAARRGYVHGWYHPFIREDHMDDPRSPNTLLRDDADLLARMPLSAKRGVRSIEDWTNQMRSSAREVQAASLRHVAHGRIGRRLRRATAALRLDRGRT